MSLARKMKRNKLKKVIGKCRRCLYSYKDVKKSRCDECQKEGNYPNFKRKVR